MKKWTQPEVKVFNVKMDENIAASGNAYTIDFIYYDLGGITRGGANYRYDSSNRIQDTSVTFSIIGGQKAVPNDKINTISGCLA